MEPRAREGRERTERGRDVRRLRVVDVTDAPQLADELDPMRDAVEGAQRLGDRGVVDSGRARRRGRGRGVLAVVRAGDAGLGGQLVRARELDAARTRRGRSETPRHDRGVVRRLALEDPQLRVRVLLERAVAVEMVRLDIEQDGDARLQRLDVLELKGGELADDPGVLRDRIHERRQRAADVPRDLDLAASGAKHRAQKLRRRRLAVRPGDAEQRVRKEAGAELDLAPYGELALARAADQRRFARDARALDDEIDPLEQRLLLASEVDFDAQLAEPSRVERLVAVESDDARAATEERLRRRARRSVRGPRRGRARRRARGRSCQG